MKVLGSIFIIYPVEFDIEANTVRIVEEAWQWRYLRFLLKPFERDGHFLAPSVYVKTNDPETYRDCLRILQWAQEELDKKTNV